MNIPATSRVFQDAEAKLRRAFENLHTLRVQRDAFFESRPYFLAVEFEPDSGWWVAKTRIEKEPPPDLGVLVGDVAYQCLSAFNLLVWELAARKLGRRMVWGSKQHIQLPIALSRKAFRDNPLVTRRLVSKPALAVIKGLQPYEETHGLGSPYRHPLPLIKEIADSDKHRVVTAAFVRANLTGIQFATSSAAFNPTQEALLTPWDTIGPETPVARVRFEVGNAEADVKVHRQPEFDLIFETDNWVVDIENVKNVSIWAFDRLHRFVPLFPAR